MKTGGYVSNLDIKQAGNSDDSSYSSASVREGSSASADDQDALVETSRTDNELSSLNQEAVDLKRQIGSSSAYRYYAKSSGYLVVAVFLFTMAMWTVCTQFDSKSSPVSQNKNSP